MKERNNLFLEYLILALAIAVPVIFFLQIKNQDVNFSHRVFAGLVKGDTSTVKLIDWEKFKAMGVDIGRHYAGQANDKEKIDYQNFFVRSFSSSFANSGGRFGSFTYWRIYAKQEGRVIIAADDKKHNKTIVFTISKYPKPKLISIDWEAAR